MLRILSILLFLLLIVLFVLDMRKRAHGKAGWNGWLQAQRNAVQRIWATRRPAPRGSVLGVLRGLFYLLTLALFVILAVTGFVPVLFFGAHLSGVLMIIHVTAAPLFALSLACLALLWAYRQRFTEENWETVQDTIGRREVTQDRLHDLTRRLCFWLVLLFSLPLILSIVLGMFPFFGTEGQEALVEVHGFSALLLTLAALIHTYTLTTHSQRRPYYHGEHA